MGVVAGGGNIIMLEIKCASFSFLGFRTVMYLWWWLLVVTIVLCSTAHPYLAVIIMIHVSVTSEIHLLPTSK